MVRAHEKVVKRKRVAGGFVDDVVLVVDSILVVPDLCRFHVSVFPCGFNFDFFDGFCSVVLCSKDGLPCECSM